MQLQGLKSLLSEVPELKQKRVWFIFPYNSSIKLNNPCLYAKYKALFQKVLSLYHYISYSLLLWYIKKLLIKKTTKHHHKCYGCNVAISMQSSMQCMNKPLLPLLTAVTQKSIHHCSFWCQLPNWIKQDLFLQREMMYNASNFKKASKTFCHTKIT